MKKLVPAAPYSPRKTETILKIGVKTRENAASGAFFISKYVSVFLLGGFYSLDKLLPRESVLVSGPLPVDFSREKPTRKRMPPAPEDVLRIPGCFIFQEFFFFHKTI